MDHMGFNHSWSGILRAETAKLVTHLDGLFVRIKKEKCPADKFYGNKYHNNIESLRIL